MFDVVATILAYFYDLTHDYGGAIMLLTSAIMVLLTPLTLKGTRSMIAMQRLQPEMKKLQTRYKDDRQKLNEEMLKFYKEHNINPVGGCLPLLIQMPVFFVLYQVLIGLTHRAPYGEPMGRAFALTARDSDAVYTQFGNFRPKHIEGTKMFEDLSNVSRMKSFGLDLADTASNVISQGLGRALPYLVLIGLIGVTAWFQQKQIQGRNPQAQAQINPQQQMIMKLMPFFLPLISFGLPAGVTLYFLVSNLYRIAQQAFITRTMYGDGAGHDLPIDTTSTEGGPPRKGLMAQLKALTEGSPPASTQKKPSSSAGGRGTKSTPNKGAGSKGSASKGSANKSSANKRTPEKRTPNRAATAKNAGSKASATPGQDSKRAGTKSAGGGIPSSKPRRPKPSFAEPAASPGAAQDGRNGGDRGRTDGVGAPNGATPDGPGPTAGRKRAAPPSRQAPAPDPNRSRTKKKRK